MIGIILIWPSHTDFKENIIKELGKENYTIKKSNSLVVSKKFIKNILREIHYGKVWWDIHIDTEYKKRINNNTDKQTLNYLIIERDNIHTCLKSFKKRVREKYKLDKSYFHISDPDCFKHLGKNCDCKCDIHQFNRETKKHIDMLNNKNTIHFLNNANFKKDYNFNQFFKRYHTILHNSDSYNIDNFCIDNGGILAAYGIRDTHDLDFLTLYNDDINVNDRDVGCENKNHRAEYKILGYSIKDIIENPDNHFYHFGLKFMSLEILKKFKFNRTHTIGTGHKQIRQKDINDYKLISHFL